MKGLTLWLCVEMSPRCAFSTTFIMGSVLKNCLTCYLPPNCLIAQYVTSLNIIHTTWIRGTPLLCGFIGTSFHAPRCSGMAYPRQCFRVDMTWVPSKRASISTLKASNAPVASLGESLYGAVGGGDHFPSGDPNARLHCLFYKETDRRTKE